MDEGEGCPGVHEPRRHAERVARGCQVREPVAVADDPGQQRGRQLRVQLQTELVHQPADDLAGRRGGRVDQVKGAEAVVADVMVDVHQLGRDGRCGPRQPPWAPRAQGSQLVSKPTARISVRAEGSATHRCAARRRRAGGRSTLTISEATPRRSAMRLIATAAPIVSASGFSWQIAVMRRAARNASATSERVLSRRSSVLVNWVSSGS